MEVEYYTKHSFNRRKATMKAHSAMLAAIKRVS